MNIDTQEERPWYKKKRYILSIFFLGWIIFSTLIENEANRALDLRDSKISNQIEN